jgi:hypothetical protein
MSGRRDGWEDGMIDGERASVREEGDRVEAVWPVDEDGEGIDPHSHIVTTDGLNAGYYRPAGEAPVVDDNPNSRTYTGSSDDADTRETAEWERRNRGRSRGSRGGGRSRRRPGPYDHL